MTQLIADAASEYGSDGVLVSSFTKAAAVELAGRSLPIDDSRVGTLHALCYRALGQPPIAEANLAEFNADNPDFRLSSSSGGTADEPSWEYEAKTDADAYFAAYQAQKARMVQRMSMKFNGLFDPNFMRFVLAWESWKVKNEYLDFSDLLEKALHDFDGPPVEASVLFVDEAQDCAPLMLAVARKWAKQMDRLVLAFDEEQSLYSWAGADPEQLFATEPSEPATVLSQSYRVPRAVHDLADRWRKKLSWRIEKEYLPRDAEGWVKRRFDLSYDDPWPTVRLVREMIDQGKSVMILASCGYMLRDTISAFKAEGIPFHNPYKPRRPDWNPLDPGSSRRWTPVRRVQAYLRVREDLWRQDARLWDGEQFKAWAAHIRSDDLFQRGVKTKLGSKEFALPAMVNERGAAIREMLLEGADFSPALTGDLDWLAHRLQGETGERMKYPVRIAQALGPKAVLSKPQVVVGTIHSVKGAEADVVIVFPDLSVLGKAEWDEEGPRRDSVLRMFYVAMTRAREGLVLAGPSGQRYVPWAV
jgi:DNA helicase-2/ATP-dependent DNA helicase PcrA